MTTKLILLVALVGYAVASVEDFSIPAFAQTLKGAELAEHVNKVQSLFKAAVPKYSRKSSLMGVKYTRLPEGIATKAHVEPHIAAAIPDSFDARTQWPKCADSIGAIRDQADCGSCWAFAAAESMSDRICIATQGASKFTLAADDLLACCGSFCGYGCEGGYPIRAWNWWVSNGVCTGSGFFENQGCLPYPIEPCGDHDFNGTHYHHPCQGEEDTPRCTKKCQDGYPIPYAQDKHFGKSAYSLPRNIATIQNEIMTNGPVEAAFTVYEDFDQYTGGIYQHRAGSVLGGHAVKIIGWGSENNVPYWIVANSWNTDWGENGFFRIIRGTNDCGIEEAIVAGLPKV